MAEVFVNGTMQIFTQDIIDYKKQLRWHILKNKYGKKRNHHKKIKTTTTTTTTTDTVVNANHIRAVPCYVVSNPDHLIGVLDHLRHRKQNDTYVRYIGRKHQDSWKFFVTSESNLRPFYDVDCTTTGGGKFNNNENTTTTTTNNENLLLVDNKELDDHNNSNNDNDESDSPECINLDKWCPMLMNSYIHNTIAKEKYFSKRNNPLAEMELKVEEYILHHILRNLQTPTRNSTSTTTTTPSTTVDDNDDDAIESSTILSPQSPKFSPTTTNSTEKKMRLSPLRELNPQNLLTIEPVDNHDTPSKSTRKEEEDGCRSNVVIQPQKQQTQATCREARRLRAGDVIQYYEPLKIVSYATLRQGMIVSCHPGDGIVIETSNNDLLPRGEKVRTIKRYLRGEWYECENGRFHETTYYQMDPSYNNDEQLFMNIPTKQKLLQSTYQNAMKDFQKVQQKFVLDANQEEKENTATNNSNNNTNNNTKNNNNSKAMKKADWFYKLEKCLEAVRMEAQKRRCDREQCEADEAAIQMAIQIRTKLNEQLQQQQQPKQMKKKTGCPNNNEQSRLKELIQQLSDTVDISYDQIWNYLLGNPNRLLSIRKLQDTTIALQHWLNQ